MFPHPICGEPGLEDSPRPPPALRVRFNILAHLCHPLNILSQWAPLRGGADSLVICIFRSPGGWRPAGGIVPLPRWNWVFPAPAVTMAVAPLVSRRLHSGMSIVSEFGSKCQGSLASDLSHFPPPHLDTRTHLMPPDFIP